MRNWLYRPSKYFIFLHLVSILFFAGEFLFSRASMFRFTDRLIIDEDRTLLNIFEYLPRLLPHIIEEFRMFVQSDLWRISCSSWKPFRPVQGQSWSRWFDQINSTLLSAINENYKNYRVSNIVCDFREEIGFKWRHIVVQTSEKSNYLTFISGVYQGERFVISQWYFVSYNFIACHHIVYFIFN